MNVDLIPRSQLATRLEQGWRLIPGHFYRPSDYAILMAQDHEPERNPQAVIRFFDPPPSNRLWNGWKENCKRGHPLSGDNVYMAPQRGRECRICRRLHYSASAIKRRKAVKA